MQKRKATKKPIHRVCALIRKTRILRKNTDFCEACGSTDVRYRSTTHDLKCREKGCGHATPVKRRF